MGKKNNNSGSGGNGDDAKEGDSSLTVGRGYKLQTLTSDNYDAWERRSREKNFEYKTLGRGLEISIRN